MTSSRFTIYCHINRVNGKRYVGQTLYSMEKRWGDHVSLAKMGVRRFQVFANAICKYGADAFDHEILEVVPTQEAANLAETRWIKELGCLVPNGYNLTSGGGSHGRLHDNTKRLIGESLRARWARMTSEERDSATKHMSSEAAVARWQKMPDTKQAFSKRLRTWWQEMSTEERSARQIARQKTVAPERRSATITKSWETRRMKYGRDGVKRVRSSEEYGASIKKGWANMTPEARAERGRKIKEGRRRAKEARAPRLIRINLLAPAMQ